MSAVTDKPQTPSIPAGLVETDQLLRKWGAGEFRARGRGATMHALERLRLLRDGTVFSPPAPEPEEYKIIDNVLATSPEDTKRFIVFWYCETDRTVISKATFLRISRAQAYIELRMHLAYFKGRLNGRGVNV